MEVEERLGRESIDGRPLYQYQVDMGHLSGLEVLLNHPLATDEQRIHALAPVAAARFASSYEEGGVPSWADCGAEIERLYGTTQFSQARLRTLMELSLSRYRVPVIKGDNGAVLLLQTIISQAGLPSGMLRRGRTLRGVLDELVRGRALGSDDLQSEASKLISEAVDNGKLRKAYQEAGHLPKLCADLVEAVVRLTERAKWTGGSLDPLWELPNWSRELPFRVEESTAREIVTELLGVATAAVVGDTLAVDRILSCSDGIWSMKARAVVPSEGIELPNENRQTLSIQYAMGQKQEPVGEAFRLQLQKDGSYRLPRDVEEVLVSQVSQRISLVRQDVDGRYLPLECARGESLGESATWVFEPRRGEYVYKADAPVRLRTPELLVAVAEGTEVTGDAMKTGERLSLQGVSKALWKVTGRAQVMDADGELALIHAGYEGPQVYLDFKGKTPAFQTHKFSAVFLGDPIPRRSGALSGRIEWRKAGEQEWNIRPVRAETGHLSFRLVSTDGDVLAERRRVFVLPEEFRPTITNRSVSFSLPGNLGVEGHVPNPEGNYILEFGQESKLDVTIRAESSEIGVTFKRSMLTSFSNVATGEEVHVGTSKVSSRAADGFVASSGFHDSIEVGRIGDHWTAAYSVGLQDGKFYLSDERVKGYRKALSFHPRGRTHALVVQFQNGPKLEIDEYRIKRNGSVLTVEGAAPDILIELKRMVPANDVQSDIVQLERIDPENWAIPEWLDSASTYLAVDSTHQAAPCLVSAGRNDQGQKRCFHAAIEITNESEREAELVDLYTQWTDNTHDGVASSEIDACLQWMGEFQFELRWLDPFLVLAANPQLAMRMLALARLRGQIQAEQGLRWALDDVPLFWHRVTHRELEMLRVWAGHQLGNGALDEIHRLMGQDGLSIPSRLMKSSTLRLCHPAWLEGWQERVIDWCSASGRDYQIRIPDVGGAAEAVWMTIEGHHLFDQARRRPQRLPADIDMFRTHLLAPYELAILMSRGVETERGLRDDFLFARHMIDPVQFDDAYCVALSLLEGAS